MSPTTPSSAEHTPINRPQPHHHASHLRPALFVAPPTQNASSHELDRPPLGQTPTSTRLPLLRQRTFRDDNESPNVRSSVIGDDGHAGQRKQRSQRPTTEAVWAEMQNTLEEVELAGMSGANVFEAEHARALEELRASQIELARAWARSEGGEEREEESLEGLAEETVGSGGQGPVGTTAGNTHDKVTVTSAGSAGSGSSKPKVSASATGLGSGKTQLEEETEHDIMLARRRRLANDKYFERVSKGVADVVARLAVVADKMGGVEAESQEIWGDKDSPESRNTSST